MLFDKEGRKEGREERKKREMYVFDTRQYGKLDNFKVMLVLCLVSICSL